MASLLKQFENFCANLKIDSKESGLTPLKFWGTQRWFIKQVFEGLEQDIHWFTVLKHRQAGISTASLALDLFWLFKYAGTQGSMVTDTDDNRNYFRSVLQGYLKSLPPQLKYKTVKNDRSIMEFDQRSRLAFQVAGTRKKGSLSRGKGLNFLHATECSSWVDQEGLVSLIASLAETHPNRLYVFESTARGYNMFYDMWQGAEASMTQRAIFIGWWMKEINCADEDSDIFRVYWDDRLSAEEADWVGGVREQFGFEITPGQMAWWRWKLEEEIRDPTLMYQEFPPTPDYAFQMSGSNFFNMQKVNTARKAAQDLAYTGYLYHFGLTFEDTQVMECEESRGELKVWEDPVPGAFYAIGADPAFGASEDSDAYCACVLRCYADKMVQVAEFCTNNLQGNEFAWVLLHLGGLYGNPNHGCTSMLNLELQGGGVSVLDEIRRVMTFGAMHTARTDGSIYDVVGNIRQFIYRRPDNTGNATGVFHWKSDMNTKERMMNHLRDSLNDGVLVVRSVEMMEEAKGVIRDGSSIRAAGKMHDDRVIACGLAVMCWVQYLYADLVGRRYFFDSRENLEQKARSMNQGILPEQIKESPASRVIVDWLNKKGLMEAQ